MHRRIGILGGMSPESTVEYYQYITRTYVERYGDHNYPEVIIYSVRFQPYIDWPAEDCWEPAIAGLRDAAQKLEAAGADFILIATNTFHIIFDEVQAGVNVPLLSLLDVVGHAIRARGLQRVGLLGTRFTMEKTFYHDALAKQGIEVLTPDAAGRACVHDVIYNELIAGVIREESRAGYVNVVNDLVSLGAEGIILGCTEIPLLLSENDVSVPLFDTTTIHAEAALSHAIGGA